MFNSSATPWAVAQQAPLSMGFPREEYRSQLPCSSPGTFPTQGRKEKKEGVGNGGREGQWKEGKNRGKEKEG